MVKPAAVLLLALVVVTTGCFGRGGKPAGPSETAFKVSPLEGRTNLVIKPAASAVGRVASVNLQGRFVVMSFPLGQVPTNDSRLAVFHAGAKVGEIKVTGPAQENLTVGDITAGAADEGDEIRGE